MMENVILHVYYFCKPGMAKPFVGTLKEQGLQAKVQAEDGCMQYDYFFSSQEENTVVLLEKWRDEAALAKHLEQPHMAEIRKAKEQYVEDVKLEKFV